MVKILVRLIVILNLFDLLGVGGLRKDCLKFLRKLVTCVEGRVVFVRFLGTRIAEFSIAGTGSYLEVDCFRCFVIRRK